MPETYRVGRTTFRLETLADDAPPAVHRRQAELIAKAQAIKPYRRPRSVKFPTPRPNTMTTNPPKPAGWHGKIADGMEGTVQFAGPRGGAWCVTDDGQWVLVTKEGGLYAGTFGSAARLEIVRMLVKREIDGGLRVYVGQPPTYGPNYAQRAEKWNDRRAHQHRVETQLALWAWHHLYPNHAVPVDELIRRVPERMS